MASGITIILDVAKLNAIRDGLGDKAGQVLDKAARDIEGDAKNEAPVDTGALRNSIQAKDGEHDLERIVDVGVEYGIYQEYGTHKMPAHPFLGPAVENNRKPFIEAFKVLFE